MQEIFPLKGTKGNKKERTTFSFGYLWGLYFQFWQLFILVFGIFSIILPQTIPCRWQASGRSCRMWLQLERYHVLLGSDRFDS